MRRHLWAGLATTRSFLSHLTQLASRLRRHPPAHHNQHYLLPTDGLNGDAEFIPRIVADIHADWQLPTTTYQTTVHP